MRFIAEWRLWFLVGVALLAIGYIFAQRRRNQYTIRFTSSELLDAVAPNRPNWRRHVPAVLFLGAMSAFVVAFAQPARIEEVPRERATVVIAIDVSLSMMATDVEPDRFTSAVDAATQFSAELPDRFNLGLVLFNGRSAIRVPPTQNHNQVVQALEGLTEDDLGEGTSLGGAILTSLDALEAVPPDETGTVPPARIVLLSDGTSTVPPGDDEGVAAANEAEVPVSTISFGTVRGQITLELDGVSQTIPVPVDAPNLALLAERTGGAAFSASSSDELREVYSDIGSAVGFEEELVEVSWWFSGIGLVLLLLTAGTSLVWFSRLP